MAQSAATLQKRQLRQSEIVQAAATCFMEKGYHATSVDDVARRLGCSKGRIYHYYASKTDLFFDVHREGMARLFAMVEPAMKRPGNALDVLAAMLKAHALAMLHNHDFESVVAQGVQIHRFGATTPDQRASLNKLIASRDRFEGLFKAQAAAARKAGGCKPRRDEGRLQKATPRVIGLFGHVVAPRQMVVVSY